MPRTGEHHVVENDPRFRMQLINADSGRLAAQMDTAHDYIHEKTFGPFRLGRVVQNIWISAIARDHIQHREYRKAGQKVRSKGGDYYSLKKGGGTRDDYEQEMSAIVDRFKDDILDTGETNRDMGTVLLDKLKYAVNQYAAISSDDLNAGFADLEHQVNQFLQEHGPQMLSGGHNIFEVARNARQARLHGESIARINAAMTGRYGVARAGQRTEHQQEIADVVLNRRGRAREFLNRNGMTYANETTAGAGLVAGLTIAKVAVRSTVSSATRAATFGAVGAGWAGVRTFREQGRRRKDYLRKAAVGDHLAKDKEYHALGRMAETKYNSMHASKLIDRLDAVIDDVDPTDPKTLDDALDVIAEVQARRDISNQLNIDLIEYSHGSQLERERTLLYKRLEQAKDTLQRVYDNKNSALPSPARHGANVSTPDPTTTASRQPTAHIPNTTIRGRHLFGPLAGRGITRGPSTVTTNRPGSIRTMVEARMHTARPRHGASIWDELINDVNNRDRLFRRQRLQKAAMIGGIALVTGGLVGLTAQETIGRAVAHAGGVFSDNVHGKHTLLAGIFRDTHGTDYHDKFHDASYQGYGRSHLQLSDNLHFVHSHGHSRILDDHGKVIPGLDHVMEDREGDLDPAALAAAKSAHIDVTQSVHHYTDFLGRSRTRHMDILQSAPTHYETPTLVPGAMPLYYLRGHERMREGRKWDRLPKNEAGRLHTEISANRLANSYLKTMDKKTGDLVDSAANRLRSDKRNRNGLAESPKVVIVIPVDATKDSRNVFNLLMQYNKQGVNPEAFEIVLFVAKKSKRETKVIQEIERYMDRNRRRRSKIKIRIVEEVIPPEYRNSRKVRDIATGAVIKDLTDRDVDLDDTLLVYNGADTKKVDPGYLLSLYTKMHRQPRLDILIGGKGSTRGRNPASNPRLQPKDQRISRMMERFMMPRPGYMGSTKANFIFRPRALIEPSRRRIAPGYAAYDEELGEMLK